MVNAIYNPFGRPSPYSDDLETFYRKTFLGSKDVRPKIDALTKLMPGTLGACVTCYTERLEEIEASPRKYREQKFAEDGRVRVVGPPETLNSIDTSQVLLDYLESSYNMCRPTKIE